MLLRRPASSLVRFGANQSLLIHRSPCSSLNQSTLSINSQPGQNFSTNPNRLLTTITNQTRWSKLPRTRNIRFISGKPLPQRRSKALTYLYRSAALLGGSLIILGVGVIGFFVYDATTYREDLSYADIAISELALSPRRGGPKNLPIAEVQIDDDDSEEMQKQKDKPKLVILGGGWGSVALLKTLNPDDFHVTLVSPTNYFLFTPMLPSATVGTLEFRSLVEPIRRIMTRVKGHFIRATAEEIEFSEKLVELAGKSPDGKEVRFYLPYDKLVIGVGSRTNPHGVKGLENCHFLKDIDDAQHIRNSISTNLEYACLPTTSDEERKRLLSFVVSGGGPTGVEFAAELFDLLNEDLTAHFPRILRNEISVHVIQSRGHILNTYDEAVSKYAEERFARDQVEILTNSRVQEVRSDKIIFTQKGENGETVVKELPMGFCLWSTGVSQTQFCSKVAAALGSAQTNRHALETDTHLRLNGTPLGDVYAIGDCSTVQNNVTDHLVTFLRTLAWEKGQDPEKVQLSFRDWRDVAQRVRKRFPQAADHLKRVDKLFQEFDKDQSGTLDFGELRELLMQIDSKLTSLPATAQRAHQQGKYLGHKFNKMAKAEPGMRVNDMRDGDLDEAIYKAFEYHHLGNLAYIGNSAVFDLGGGWNFAGGLWAVYAWRSVYFAQSVSFRTRCLLAMDWTKRALFGRGMFSFVDGRLQIDGWLIESDVANVCIDLMNW
ncbi:putative alternative NADH dehydrogenase [Sclerotinia borealis F-4128]|uniref:Putative alternative NADH dehydrogenase n=1 Tax=Sclerotinia borealis (strain F-4128) TaxID=1432307 RepID=W9CN06_SCLBF|nr:putative alternative NADH dehydrogenase [Sclerotinia borealis F-4128]